MVLNRYQKYVKVIERSKGPSTILETKLSLACYKIHENLVALNISKKRGPPNSVKYFKF